jgi:ParB family chromosome partitioning protein
MGVRSNAAPAPQLRKANAKDVGRRPDRKYGNIAIDQVKPDPTQPRTEFDEDSLNELSASIAAKGQLQPIRVRWSDSESKWIIIAGERRWRAVQMAGLATVACYFHDSELSKSEILEEQVIENMQRQSLQPMEEAKAFAALIEMNNWKRKQVAEALGIHPAKVSRALALLKLPEDLQQQVAEEKISARTGYEISKITNNSQQRMLAADVTDGKLSHSETRNRVRLTKGKSGKLKSAGTKLTFTPTENHRIVVTSPVKTPR